MTNAYVYDQKYSFYEGNYHKSAENLTGSIKSLLKPFKGRDRVIAYKQGITGNSANKTFKQAIPPLHPCPKKLDHSTGLKRGLGVQYA